MVAGHSFLAGLELLDCLPRGCEIARHRPGANCVKSGGMVATIGATSSRCGLSHRGGCGGAGLRRGRLNGRRARLRGKVPTFQRHR